MTLALKLLAVFALLQISAAVQEFTKFDMWWAKKYPIHRKPPIEKRSKFPLSEIEEEIIEEKWIEQRLNNFDPQDNRTFLMRYYENRNHLQEGGPIFIFIGGEWWIDEYTLVYGHVPDMMREMNGIMFYTEHRFYGKSHPTEDLTTESLRYLNIDQALADLAHFIVEVKATIPEIKNSGVILIGGSYSATMATWFMQKYPHLANGAWSSSAPLEAKVDFVEYKEVVSDALRTLGGNRCSARIESAYKEFDQLVEEGNSERLEELFQLCYPLNLTDTLDRWSFTHSVGGSFSGLVQYHREIYQDIQEACNTFVNTPIENDLEALAYWFTFDEDFDPEYPVEMCFDHRYSTSLYFLGGTDWYDFAALFSWRQWIYQTCAEYGWYQSSGSENILFGSSFPSDFYIQQCADLYSDLFTPEQIQRNVDRTNVIYGSKMPNVRNVYSTHGQFDPWRPMGVQEDINESSPTEILPNETHCSDLSSMSEFDSPEMTASKERVTQLIRQWLGLSSA